MGCAAGTTKVYDSPEELDLVRRAKQGDESAYNVLHRTHHTRVMAAIMKVVRDPDLAEWLANNAMKNVWLGLPKFQEQSKFTTWVTTIAINEARMHLRREKKRHCEVSLEGTLPDEESSNHSYAEQWVAIKDKELEGGIADRELLERAFEKVPVQFQEVLRLRLFQEMSLEEIRARVSSEGYPASISSVKSRILRGRRMLMEQVNQLSHNAEVMS